MTTGEKITKCRKEKGMTQEQLAETLKVTRQAVSRWEGDLAFPETDTLMKMSRLFGVSCDYLLNYEEQETAGEENCREEKSVNIKSLFNFKQFYFEYESKTHIGKLPLVHINIGIGRVAKGVFSVGLVSVGVVSLGLVSLGLISLGILCLGILSFASLSAGLVAFGGAAIGFIAFGGLAVGFLAVGGCAIGAFACGGFAYGSIVAVGDVAVGGIAIGETKADGTVISVLKSEYALMKTAVYAELDKIPKIWYGFTSLMRSCANTFM